MHTFQPYPIDMLDINPFTKLSMEWALVTAGDKEKSNTMTICLRRVLSEHHSILRHRGISR